MALYVSPFDEISRATIDDDDDVEAGGEVQTILFWSTYVDNTLLSPKAHFILGTKPIPVKATAFPPLMGPSRGEMDVIVGDSS
jgi:hypothetical protein